MDTILTHYASDGGKPKYRAVAGAIRTAVERGQMAPGDRLPPVRELAWRLGITPGTVARAYTVLTDEGALIAEVGRGTYVAPPKAQTKPLLGLEVDSVAHLAGGDVYEVNLVSPHLPNVGQVALIRQLMAEVAQDPPSGVMHYPSHATGCAARAAVAAFLADVTLGGVTADDIVLTHGAQNGVVMVMQAVLTGRRPVVLVEELAYPGYRRAAELMRAEVVPVAMDEHGIIPEALEAAARSTGAQLLCLGAEVQNPLLIAMPPERRAEIARIAQRLDFQILEDDCYRLGSVSGPSFRALAPERGWYVASLSKILTPALRVGWAVPPRAWLPNLRRTAEYGFFGLATPMTDLTAALLTHPQLPALRDALRETVADYIRTMVNVLGAFDLTWREDALYVWLNLPPGWRASAFARAAEAEGVQVRTAEDYADRNAPAPHAIRLTVNAGVSRASFEAALERLRVLLDNPPDRIAV